MKGARVLMLVDDSRDDLALALRALRRLALKVEVRTASDGREALAALHVRGSDGASEPVTPSVIFLDVRMPDVDGFEVLRALRRAPHTRVTPVVMISTSSSPDDLRRAYELGANSYLVKRADSLDSGSQIADAARYWIELNNFLPNAG
ncbi:MAG TPA: response regulator [Myxococcota bacterium]|nr:response regulator [Myxococcota bacterium]